MNKVDKKVEVKKIEVKEVKIKYYTIKKEMDALRISDFLQIERQIEQELGEINSSLISLKFGFI